MSNKDALGWVSANEELPRRWKWVEIQLSAPSRRYIGYRTFFGTWKSKSGMTQFITPYDYWRII